MTASAASDVTLRVAPPRAECVIDLAALRANVRTLADSLVGGAELWAVVKANAYGHDVDRVAQEAVAAGARRLCVATLSEARQLRNAGLRVPMLIMGPLDSVGVARAIDLDVAISALSSQIIDAVIAAAAERPGVTARVHLKVDTGMGRWGVPHACVLPELERLMAAPGVDVEGVMTHFATADDLDDGGFFEQQLDCFRDVIAVVREHLPTITAHAANSAATLRTEDAHFDAVRCGVAIYGMSPTQGNPAAERLAPVMSVRSYVADIRDIAAGDSVGYGRRFIADGPARIATVPIGYADGIRRLLTSRGAALVNGSRYLVAGTVSMDHLSLVIDDSVAIGDVVTVLGRDGDDAIRAEEHAAWADTINYEITCGIAGEPRLQRRHVTAR